MLLTFPSYLLWLNTLLALIKATAHATSKHVQGELQIDDVFFVHRLQTTDQLFTPHTRLSDL